MDQLFWNLMVTQAVFMLDCPKILVLQRASQYILREHLKMISRHSFIKGPVPHRFSHLIMQFFGVWLLYYQGASALFSKRSAHENHPNFLRSLGHRPQPRVILILSIWQNWHDPRSGSVTQGHRDNWGCTSFGKECMVFKSSLADVLDSLSVFMHIMHIIFKKS